ncbi:outer membrane beta-barrel protein [Fulvimarina sp. 2208YS6-2-32]|uniref:Outer membrane beta-barrel protein n=1 Tax=Fulvimarina uroteuthidis TaxID=3098149 RepID=A0ABU5HZ86_9HYPH|nr:outer membrane beta-barrel protein [Fulvimarina sp. 2208YS6-2-32]MDY8108439.1 outer membrane beta-barrel protein [Fulvimarina sp. 2208YS6-2-32]
MAANRFSPSRRDLAAWLAGTALCGLCLGVLPASSQETTRRAVVDRMEDRRIELRNEETDALPDRDRRPLGESPSIFLKTTDQMTTAERELMRELYREGSSVDRLDDDEFGRDGPDDTEDAAQARSFDIFAGPEETPGPPAAAGINRRAAAARPESRAGESANASASAVDGSDAGLQSPFSTQSPDMPDGSAVRTNPADRKIGVAASDAGFANAPLSAGVAGEVLSSDSLLRSNDPARAIERIARPPSADDPFAAVGLRAGSVTIYPELYQGAGASSNIDERAGGEGGAFSRTELNVKAVTDWSRHGAELNGRLTYRRNFGGDDRTEPEAALDGRLQLDLGALTTATLRGAMTYRRDDEVSLGPELAGSEPEILAGSVSAQVAREFGRSTVTGGLTLAREHYLSRPAGLPDLGYSTATANLRAAYGLSPAFAPFVEASIGRRFFDEPLGGGDHATIPSLRAGLAIDLAEKLRGEVALGYAMSMPDEGEASSAPTLDANLVWSLQRGTDLVLETRTTFDPDGAGGSSATYNGSLGFLHTLNNRLDLNGALRAELETDDALARDPLALAAEIGFTYWLNRSLSFTGLYEYETSFETDPADDWSANTVSLGVRLRR